MRTRYEFAFHDIGAGRDPNDDATLALLGSQGWELRGIASGAAGLVVALQRPADEEHPLAEAEVLAATLEAPLRVPGPDEFESV